MEQLLNNVRSFVNQGNREGNWHPDDQRSVNYYNQLLGSMDSDPRLKNFFSDEFHFGPQGQNQNMQNSPQQSSNMNFASTPVLPDLSNFFGKNSSQNGGIVDNQQSAGRANPSMLGSMSSGQPKNIPLTEEQEHAKRGYTLSPSTSGGKTSDVYNSLLSRLNSDPYFDRFRKG